jgi:hypothetical protein
MSAPPPEDVELSSDDEEEEEMLLREKVDASLDGPILEEDEDEDEYEEEEPEREEIGFLSRVPIFPILMILLAVAGLVLHRGNNYSARAQQIINSPFVFGILLMLHSFYGSKGITEPPAVLTSISKSRFVKIFTLLLVGFVATRDLEDTLFATMMFLGATQLLRTPAERAKHPAIL